MPSILEEPLKLFPDQISQPPPDQSTDQGTRPVNTGDLAIAQAMNPPPVQADPGQTDISATTGPARIPADTSSTFKPLTPADPKNKADVETINLFNQYLASGKSIDDLSPAAIMEVKRAATGTDALSDDAINNNPELFYQLKFRTGKYDPTPLDEIGNPIKGAWDLAGGFLKGAYNTVVGTGKALWDTAWQDFQRGDVVVPMGPFGLPLSPQGAAQRAALYASGGASVLAGLYNLAAGTSDVANEGAIALSRPFANPSEQETLDRKQSEVIREALLRNEATQKFVDNAKGATANLIANVSPEYADLIRNAPVTPEQTQLADTLMNPLTYLEFGAGKAAAESAAGKVGTRFSRLEGSSAALQELNQTIADQGVQRSAFQAIIDSPDALPAEQAAAQKSLAKLAPVEAQTAQALSAAQAEHQAAIAGVNQDLVNSAKTAAPVSGFRQAAGTIAQSVGERMQAAGEAAAGAGQKVESMIDSGVGKVFPGASEDTRATLSRVAMTMLGEHLTGSIAGALTGGLAVGTLNSVGRTLSMIGSQLLLGQQTLPFWKAIAENSQGLTKALASMLDNQLVYSIPDTVRGAAMGGLIGGGQGFLSSSGTLQGLAQGMGGGAVMGTAGAGLGQIRKFNSPAELHVASIGDRSRFISGLTQDSRNLFSRFSPSDQLPISSYAMAHPDLHINFFDDPSNTSYNGNHQVIVTPDGPTAVANLNVSGDNPLQQILAHETGHHVAAHGLEEQVYNRMVGDPVTGTPGVFAKRNPDGTPMKQMDRFGIARFVPDDTFEAYKAKYNAALPSGHPPENDFGIAQELFADYHAQAISDPQAVQKMVRSGIVPDALVGDAALKNWFARIGVPMDSLTGNPRMTDAVTQTSGLGKMVTDFYQKRNYKLDKPDDERGVPRIPISEIHKGTPEFDHLENQFDATSDLKRNPDGTLATDLAGRPILVPQKTVDALQSKMTDEAFNVLKAQPQAGAGNPNTLKLTTDRAGRQFYVGQNMPEEVFNAWERSPNQYNASQVLNARKLNGIMDRNDGTMITMVYNTPQRGGRYASLAARERAVVPIQWEVSPGTKQTVIKAYDPEQLQENATKALRKAPVKAIWDGKIDALTDDIKTYLDNYTNNRPGETGIGLQKKGVINQLFGFNTDANLTVAQLELKNPSVFKSFRIDRINRLQELPGVTQPFDFGTYEKVRGFMQPRRMGRGMGEGIPAIQPRAGAGAYVQSPKGMAADILLSPVPVQTDDNTKTPTIGEVVPDSPMYKEHPWLKNMPLDRIAQRYLAEVSKTL